MLDFQKEAKPTELNSVVQIHALETKIFVIPIQPNLTLQHVFRMILYVTLPSRIGGTVEGKLMGFATQNWRTTLSSEGLKGSFNDGLNRLLLADIESNGAIATHKIHIDKHLSSTFFIIRLLH